MMDDDVANNASSLSLSVRHLVLNDHLHTHGPFRVRVPVNVQAPSREHRPSTGLATRSPRFKKSMKDRLQGI